MPRRPSPEREAEFDRLIGILEALGPVLFPVTEGGVRPPARADVMRIRAGHGFSGALEGLRQAVNDSLEMLTLASPEEREVAATALAKAGLGSLGQLLGQRKRYLRELLKRGSLISDTEYYALKEIAVNEGRDFTEVERELADRMVSSYEARRTP